MRRLALILLPVLLGRLPRRLRRRRPSDNLPDRLGQVRRQAEDHGRQGQQAAEDPAVRRVVQGNGPKVKKGDLLVADYLGEIYKTGKVFDNSYDRKVAGRLPDRRRQGRSPGWDKAWSASRPAAAC